MAPCSRRWDSSVSQRGSRHFGRRADPSGTPSPSSTFGTAVAAPSSPRARTTPGSYTAAVPARARAAAGRPPPADARSSGRSPGRRDSSVLPSTSADGAIHWTLRDRLPRCTRRPTDSLSRSGCATRKSKPGFAICSSLRTRTITRRAERPGMRAGAGGARTRNLRTQHPLCRQRLARVTRSGGRAFRHPLARRSRLQPRKDGSSQARDRHAGRAPLVPRDGRLAHPAVVRPKVLARRAPAGQAERRRPDRGLGARTQSGVPVADYLERA
jgi:hypothetical protein